MPTFFSPNALESMRASGYKNTPYAIAELVDNSFDADAETVKVIFFQKSKNRKKYIDEIVVSDDGKGMVEEQLQVCLQFGFTGNDDLEKIVRARKKGKFGFGLPNASISQAREIGVYSRIDSSAFRFTQLSLDDLKESDSIEIPDLKERELPGHYLNAKAHFENHSGTIVSWKKCDLLSNAWANTIIEKSVKLLGRIYRYMLAEGKTIILEVWDHNTNQDSFSRSQSVKVVPNDPLFLMNNTYIARILHKAAKSDSGIADPESDPANYYRRFSESKTQCKPTNVELEDYCYEWDQFIWKGKAYKFRFKVSYAHIDIQKPGIREGGKTAVGNFYAEEKRISFLRAEREICIDNFGFYRETEPRNRWWGIEVHFDANADDLLGVSNNKQGITFVSRPKRDGSEDLWDPSTATLQQAREQLWWELTNKIEAARKAVWKIVRSQHTQWESEHGPGSSTDTSTGIPQATDETIRGLKKTDGTRQSRFTDRQKEDLLNRLKKKYPHLDEQEIVQGISNFDEQRVRGCILYCPSDSDSLWSFTDVYGFLIILINTNHEFYMRVLHPFRNHDFKVALSAIELFISSLAREESTQFPDPTQKGVLESFRSYVGLHLNRYLHENQIEVPEADLTVFDEILEEG